MGAGLTISIFFTCQTFIFWIFWKQIIWYLEEKFAKIHLPISQFYLLPGDGHWDMWSTVSHRGVTEWAILKIKKTHRKLFLTSETVKNTEKGNFGVSIMLADGLGMLGGHLQTWWWLCSIPWWCHQMETFSALLTLCVGNSPVNFRWISHVNFPHKGQWHIALMFSLIGAYDWVNNRDAGDLRCHHAHYDVTVMTSLGPALGGSTLLGY